MIRLSIDLDEETIEKIEVLAKQNKRDRKKQIEFMISGLVNS